ncbi:deaminase [Desulfobacula sp.]|jgi:deoxycytidylate deaminase|uniref:deaminase n=1 Tax=Desulfobacula sp. TaxID=2593537 RepID=UPI0039B9855F
MEEYLLNKSSIKDITEYGRIVHAEMEAILACSRTGIGTEGAELYCTTFPCHNCAKHIIGAGIKRVVYIEPYPKSKAFQFHSDSISTELASKDKVIFEPFVGVGPRNFFNLFSMKFGSGYPLKRKNKDGTVSEWNKKNGRLRMQMLPCSYLEREDLAANLLSHYLEEIDENSQ